MLSFRNLWYCHAYFLYNFPFTVHYAMVHKSCCFNIVKQPSKRTCQTKSEKYEGKKPHVTGSLERLQNDPVLVKYGRSGQSMRGIGFKSWNRTGVAFPVLLRPFRVHNGHSLHPFGEPWDGLFYCCYEFYHHSLISLISSTLLFNLSATQSTKITSVEDANKF